MARLDELAEGIATVLAVTSDPEPLPVDMVGETPADATVFVRAVTDACERNATPIARVMIGPDLGKALLGEHPESYEGVRLVADERLVDRIEFFRFPPI
jgi:hypothetical protein